MQIVQQFEEITEGWLKAKGVPDGDIDPSDGGLLTATDPRLSRDDVSAVAAMLAYIGTSPRTNTAISARLENILNAADAPADVHALALIVRYGRGTSIIGQAQSRASGLGAQLKSFDAKWPNSRAAIWLRLEYALALEGTHDMPAAAPQYEAVLAAPTSIVGESDQIRQLATLHLATLKKRTGDVAGAMALITQSSLSADQCSQFDVRPAATNASVSSADFPIEAMRWHFEGFARESFDIAADGHVTNVRTVLAYPPFIFEKATEKAVGRFRFLPPIIDGAPAGCSGQGQTINYRLPG